MTPTGSRLVGMQLEPERRPGGGAEHTVAVVLRRRRGGRWQPACRARRRCRRCRRRPRHHNRYPLSRRPPQFRMLTRRWPRRTEPEQWSIAEVGVETGSISACTTLRAPLDHCSSRRLLRTKSVPMPGHRGLDPQKRSHPPSDTRRSSRCVRPLVCAVTVHGPGKEATNTNPFVTVSPSERKNRLSVSPTGKRVAFVGKSAQSGWLIGSLAARAASSALGSSDTSSEVRQQVRLNVGLSPPIPKRVSVRRQCPRPSGRIRHGTVGRVDNQWRRRSRIGQVRWGDLGHPIRRPERRTRSGHLVDRCRGADRRAGAGRGAGARQGRRS